MLMLVLQVAAGSSAEQQPVLEPGEGPWPAAGFPGPPRCRPISTVTELLTWQPPQPAAAAAAAATQPTLNTSSSSSGAGADPCVCTTPLVLPQPSPPQGQPSSQSSAPAAADGSSSSSSAADRTQLLVCHDMRGGYLDYESLLAGSPDAAEYRLWHWDCIDCFVYFRCVWVLVKGRAAVIAGCSCCWVVDVEC